MSSWVIKQGDALDVLHKIKDNSVDCVITSPPYWGLRDYQTDGQLGQEKDCLIYLSKLSDICRGIYRVLKPSGNFFINIGDSYCKKANNNGIRKKSLVGIPQRLFLMLIDQGWIVRQEIIWCLSGGTWLYTRTRKGDSLMTIKDIYRLKPNTVKVWNGNKWTNIKGISKTRRAGNEIEFTLRSGERISCTPGHRFPTQRGVLEAKDIVVGDKFEVVNIPEPEKTNDSKFINEEAAWFVGMYLAEGSKSRNCIQISGHAKEHERWDRLSNIATLYGGHITRTIKGNKMDIRLYGKVLNSLLQEFVSGRTAKDKCLAPSCWNYSNSFLKALLEGYLAGDGHWDKNNKRWRLGFTRNYNLERDLRALSARLNFDLTLNLANSFIKDKKYPSFRGEIRFDVIKGSHLNQKDKAEIVSINKARCRELYDIGVEDAPYVFSLSSGIITHNSKPNPIPESVTDRCTRCHEHIFHCVKTDKYYWDKMAIATPAKDCSVARLSQDIKNQKGSDRANGGAKTNGNMKAVCSTMKNLQVPRRKPHTMHVNRLIKQDELDKANYTGFNSRYTPVLVANARDVWDIPTKGFKGSHFAVFPEELVRRCILAGCPEKGIVFDPFCGSGTSGIVAVRYARRFIGGELNPGYCAMAEQRIAEESNKKQNSS